MKEVLETVTIETENGPVRINKGDFDEKKHKLFEEKKETVKEDKPKKTKQKKKVEEPNVESEFIVMPVEDGKFGIFDENAEQIVEETFDSVADAEDFLKGEGK